MLKIHQIFIIKFLLLLVGSLVFTSLISYIVLKSVVVQHNKNHLKHAIELMDLQLQSMNSLDKLDEIALSIHKRTMLRVTIVNAKGVVLAESNTDKKSMDNHGHRYEIREAEKSKYGDIIRYSKTLKVDFLYVSKKIYIGKEKLYIRLSMSLAQIMNDFYHLWLELLLVFIGVIIVAAYISRTMSKKIVYDISQIRNYLDEISNKNYKAVIKTKYFYEFLQISLLLKNLVKKLSKNDKKKIKHMARLRLINKQRNDILSALSHEFKNPIASINGYAQTIQEDSDMPLAVRNKFLGKISSNAQKISKMLDRLAMSVKLENGDLTINKSEFNLKQLCSEVANNLSSKYRDRDIIVDSDEGVVLSDRTMLELVLINLVDNALKYSTADVELSFKDGVVSVKDSGIGIQEEDIDKVVTKFYRVDKNSWDNSMGIGLAMVSYILKSLDSSLEIESEFAKGSRFSFSVKEMLKS